VLELILNFLQKILDWFLEIVPTIPSIPVINQSIVRTSGQYLGFFTGHNTVLLALLAVLPLIYIADLILALIKFIWSLLPFVGSPK